MVQLVGVQLENGNDEYPNGDEVQTVEPWGPPKTWDGLSSETLNAALTKIDAGMQNGQRYSGAPTAPNGPHGRLCKYTALTAPKLNAEKSSEAG